MEPPHPGGVIPAGGAALDEKRRSMVTLTGQREIVITLTGASAALAGLVLVFLGFLIASYQPLIGRVGEQTLARFRAASKGALAVFFVSLLSLLVDTTWLVAEGDHAFYVGAVVLFFVLLAALAALALFSTVRVLLQG
jgi:hypothetical protein